MNSLPDLVRERGNLLSLCDLLELMERFDLSKIISIIRMLQICESGTAEFDWTVLYRQIVEAGGEDFIVLRDFCTAMGMDASAERLGQVVNWMDDTGVQDLHGGMTREERKKEQAVCLSALRADLTRESKKPLFLAFRDTYAIYWTNPTKGWEEVCDKLPETRDHVRLANQCYALDQPTACAYHLCCAVEMGVRWLPKKFKGIIAPIPGTQTWKNWRVAITTYTKGRPALWRDLDRIVDKLESMERGVRNQVMHPNCEIGEKDARLVLDASHSILSEIAGLKGRKAK